MSSTSPTTTTTTTAPNSLAWSPIASLKGSPGPRGTGIFVGNGPYSATTAPNAQAGDTYLDVSTGNIGVISTNTSGS